MAEQTAEEFTQRWCKEIWDRQNLDAIDDLYADDYVGYDPMLSEPIRGPEEARDAIAQLHSTFPDAEVEVEEVVTDGERVATYATLEGTHEGEFLGIEPTGNEVTVESLTISRIEDGEIVESREIFDVFGLLQQLDAIDIPSP